MIERLGADESATALAREYSVSRATIYTVPGPQQRLIAYECRSVELADRNHFLAGRPIKRHLPPGAIPHHQPIRRRPLHRIPP
ncbi:hypothetical protein [Skermania piniformis]|uniref:hypothetical protein n=1 Tax=Skermania pinensis TaxID=39122 RepID=UPI00278C146B|nr:hypothetical protein [Skermania piniformis]